MTTRSPLRRFVSRMAMALWLLGIWLLLWGRVDALTVAGGILVVAGAYKASRLPNVPLVKRIRPIRLAAVIGEFVWDLLVSSVVIGAHALYRPGRVQSSIIDVGMTSRSEIILLGVTTSISLRPGTILIDLSEDRGTLRIHAMPTSTRQEAESIRQGVELTEERMRRAFVTWEDEPEDAAQDAPSEERR